MVSPALNASVFLTSLGLVLVGYPKIGYLIAKSRWTPIAWCAAISIGITGSLLFSYGFVPDHRIVVTSWSPLYQLCLYTLAINLFIRAVRRPPRNVVYSSLTDDLLWDRLFCCSVGMLSIFPVVYFLAPRWK
jgi:hypothetical protein